MQAAFENVSLLQMQKGNGLMRVALIGCGYVADAYMRSLREHSELEIIGATDRNADRARTFCAYHHIQHFLHLDDILSDHSIEMVINLTNPESHFGINAAAMGAGKHVYSEKPIALCKEDVAQLSVIAEQNSVLFSSAPCHVISESIDVLVGAVDAGVIGKPVLAYVAYEDDIIAPNKRPWEWRSESGAPWPAKNEFETGCTYQHAGYCLTILHRLFGRATAITAFSTTLVPDKGVSVGSMAPDFSVSSIEYPNGLVATVTIGLVAPGDRSIVIVGTTGSLRITNIRNDTQNVDITVNGGLRGLIRRVASRLDIDLGNFGRFVVYKRIKSKRFGLRKYRQKVDYLLGPVELIKAISETRRSILGPELGQHIAELSEVMQHPERFGNRRVVLDQENSPVASCSMGAVTLPTSLCVSVGSKNGALTC
ncbi:Gfo/Idh/MocA family protein [Sphingomonas qomolangmaensis]|uniref:Gfo/Idh/MocA family oxidoreductase n=1 Tax=Sphingomonas qomolangmaensis TaxID=2918765 RepID=A0ABY5L9Y7_9SPHN|nr:Gfo/Idh/MocA family oxidoreductase [Sphingomonas qomolangmaensis]UUL82413.1 Gfo/Idh/MocA family oxidoreductase [Sphingomonas qomolangmaensis]